MEHLVEVHVLVEAEDQLEAERRVEGRLLKFLWGANPKIKTAYVMQTRIKVKDLE